METLAGLVAPTWNAALGMRRWPRGRRGHRPGCWRLLPWPAASAASGSSATSVQLHTRLLGLRTLNCGGARRAMPLRPRTGSRQAQVSRRAGLAPPAPMGLVAQREVGGRPCLWFSPFRVRAWFLPWPGPGWRARALGRSCGAPRVGGSGFCLAVGGRGPAGWWAGEPAEVRMRQLGAHGMRRACPGTAVPSVSQRHPSCSASNRPAIGPHAAGISLAGRHPGRFPAAGLARGRG